LLWQAVGSAFGLGAQVTFAGLVRFLSLRVANAIGIGLAFVSAQAFGAFVLFREPFAPAQWLGTALVFAGTLLIALGRCVRAKQPRRLRRAGSRSLRGRPGSARALARRRARSPRASTRARCARPSARSRGIAASPAPRRPRAAGRSGDRSAARP